MYLIIRRFFHYGEVPEHFRSSKKMKNWNSDRHGGGVTAEISSNNSVATENWKTEILTDMEVGLLPRSPVFQFFILFSLQMVPEHFWSNKKNWKTEILTDMEMGLLPRSPQIIQFFSFSVRLIPWSDGHWMVRMKRNWKFEKLKNWNPDRHGGGVATQISSNNSVFQFFRFSVLFLEAYSLKWWTLNISTYVYIYIWQKRWFFGGGGGTNFIFPSKTLKVNYDDLWYGWPMSMWCPGLHAEPLLEEAVPIMPVVEAQPVEPQPTLAVVGLVGRRPEEVLEQIYLYFGNYWFHFVHRMSCFVILVLSWIWHRLSDFCRCHSSVSQVQCWWRWPGTGTD